jgi:hypothetical protein
MRFGTIQTLYRKLWQWTKDQIAQDVPASDGLCEYDCRKQQCTEEEWATCERRIGRAAGELWPDRKLTPTSPQSRQAVNYRSIPVSHSREEQALARLRCAHCQSLFDCEGLAQAVLTELRVYRIESRSVGGGHPEVTDPELIKAVRRGIDCFLRDSFGSAANSEGRPPAP